MTGLTPREGGSRWLTAGTAAVGGLIGGLVGASAAVAVTEVIKRVLAVVSRQDTWVLVVMPLVGLALAVLVLHGWAKGEAVRTLAPLPARRRYRPRLPLTWTTFPRDAARADLTADVVATAGEEERFPWRLALVRALAIVATVGLGAPMGTEAPAAHLGVAGGSWLGSIGPRWRRLTRPAAVGGGAAGVAALMGIPLVGTVFMLELGRRRSIPLSTERLVSALVGGLVGWVINVAFDLDLIRLVVPQVAPGDLSDALGAALRIGAIAGAITSLTGAAIYRARGWQASPQLRLLVGGVAVAAIAVTIAAIAAPGAAIGPSGGAIVWAETNTDSAALTLVGPGGAARRSHRRRRRRRRIRRCVRTVPRDWRHRRAGVRPNPRGAGRSRRGRRRGRWHRRRLSPPWTAAAMAVGIGGPYLATLTCLATVAASGPSSAPATRPRTAARRTPPGCRLA